jgi:hypothetical protein
MDKPRKPLDEQFRTLDERAPQPSRPLGMRTVGGYTPSVGYWQTDLTRRPNAWRRFWVRVFLGHTWFDYN